MSEIAPHIPVLSRQVVGALSPTEGDTYVDATAGLGGHALLIARHLGPAGSVVLNDLDPANLARARERVRQALAEAGPGLPTIHTIHGSFADLPRQLGDAGLRASMLLADLGFASNQLADPTRGLAFSLEGPLDMRLDPTAPTSAFELVNELDEEALARILRELGEEPDAGRIARKIHAARAESPIATTSQLAQIVRAAIPARGGPRRIDPATRTFQALRIAVNNEIGNLEMLLRAVEHAARDPDGFLAPGARVAIISFHSLEDRPVKRSFAALVAQGLATSVSLHPIRAEEDEILANPRARSAKLRAIRLTRGIM